MNTISLPYRNKEEQTIAGNRKMTESRKIINWAANESNAYGAHISALTYAIDGDRITSATRVELKAVRSEWVAEQNKRIARH